MKKTLIAFVSGVALAVVLLFMLNMPARAGASPAPPERHPEIQAAINHLRQAKENLEKGAHDFKGHRAEALKHTNAALEECRLALESD
jgi:hypothetical protein